MNKFESVILYSPNLSTSDIKKQDNDFKKKISKMDGVFVDQEDWGLRDLSYKIGNNKKAFYRFFQIEIDGNKIQEIKKSLTQNEQIIRHLIIKVEKHEELPTKLLKKEI